MNRASWLSFGAACSAAMFTLAACGSAGESNSTFSATTGSGMGASGASGASTSTTSSSGRGGSGVGGAGGSSGSSNGGAATGGSSSSSGGGCGECPTGYACGTANGIPVCRTSAGIPLFSHVFVIMMENTSLSTLQAAMNATPSQAPNLAAMVAAYATASDYHGVTHPSLPNYIALTSGGTQNTVCDCDAQIGGNACYSSFFTCEAQLAVSSCACPNTAMNIADQIEAASLTWMAFGEDMGTPCNMTDSGNYAQRHVPFLYYEDIQTDVARCTSHVVDFTNFAPDAAPTFTFIAPNLIDDMHNPDPTTSVNIPDGDAWIGPHVADIMASTSFKQGGLLVVLWDEDDASGGVLGDTDDPIGIFVMSPYAKSGGFVSAVKADHYALLATIEDGLQLPRLGSAASASPLSDFFPAE